MNNLNNQYPPMPPTDNWSPDNQFPPILPKNNCYTPDLCQLKPGYYKWVPPHWECCDCWKNKKKKVC